MADDPSEWIYVLEETELQERPAEGVLGMLDALGVGEETPNVFEGLFANAFDAHVYFNDVPCKGDRVILSNRKMMKYVKLISSGKLVD